jgi:phosphoglycerol transferase MdoB-like AlkP superfamily enzyme
LILNTLDQWKIIIPKNWALILGGFVIFYFFSKLYDFIPQKNILNNEKPHWFFRILSHFTLIIFTIALYILGGRGGFQLRPITPISAADYVKDSRWIPLLSNTTMSFFCSFQQNFIQKKNYFDEKSIEKYTQKWSYRPDNQTFRPMNVVVIAMESFGCDYTSTWNDTKGFTPFLDSLLHEGTYCEQSFANATRSAQGIVAITAGIPQLMDDALQFSPYQNNQINSFASLLKEKNYYSAFFHASKPGSMMFDKYAGLAAYDHFEDKTAYPNPADDDGNWGIFDVPYFQYVVKKMNEMPQPFHTFTFSLTSHYPFVAERWFEEKYPNLEPYQRSVLYSDYALRKFFETASQQKWFENTIFVISADHTGPFPSPKYQTRLGKFRIPILFYSANPSLQKELKQKLENVTLQQIDILPSVMSLLHYDQPFKTFGKNIFQKEKDNSFSINYLDGIFQVISPKYNLVFDGEKTIGMYDYQKDIFLTKDLSKDFPDLKKEMEDYLKAAIQVHHQEMIDNRLK